MNIAGLHTTKPRTQRYVEAFVRGTPGPFKIYDFKKLRKLPEETLTFYGILAGSGEVYKKCLQARRDFYFMDHGYFGNAHEPPHYLRITKNSHCQTQITHTDSDRWNALFAKPILDWNLTGSKILVLPPTNAIADFFGARAWLNNTLEILKQHTDREIDIREKPFNPPTKTDKYGATVKIKVPTNHQPPIVWSNYHACVTYNSNTAVTALLNGVPVFCNPDTCAVAPVAGSDYSQIETPRYGDREQLFYSLAYNNFSMKEMANGTAWEILSEG